MYEPPSPGLAPPAEWEPASQWAADPPSGEPGFEIASEIGPAIDVGANDRVVLANPKLQRSDSGFKHASSNGASRGRLQRATVSVASTVTLEEPAIEKTSAARPQSLAFPRAAEPQIPQCSTTGDKETRLRPADRQSLPKLATQPDIGAAFDDRFESAGSYSIDSLHEALAQPFGRPPQSPVMQPGAARRLRLEPLQIPTRVQKAEPTIQVTIGRVEVRAVPEQAGRARKERSSSPVMGLNEYLRRRAKGGTP
jgi:hypothetical protein